MIDNLLRANLSTMNRYFPGMMELIYSDKSPKELIQKIEGAEEAETSGVDSDDDEEDDYGAGEFRIEPDDDEEEEQGGDKRQLG